MPFQAVIYPAAATPTVRVELADSKHSQFLCNLYNMFCDQAASLSEECLCEPLLQKLLQHVRTLFLMSQASSFTELAALDDKIMEKTCTTVTAAQPDTK